jgi:hypothetical protein
VLFIYSYFCFGLEKAWMGVLFIYPCFCFGFFQCRVASV